MRNTRLHTQLVGLLAKYRNLEPNAETAISERDVWYERRYINNNVKLH
jgi:hypothetical protein